MPELRWNQTDLLECFGVLPETEEYGTYFGYTVTRDGLELLATVRPYESVIDLRLRRENGTEDLLGFTLFVGGAVEYKREKKRDFVRVTSCRVVADRLYYMHEGGAGAVSEATLLDVEIAVDPDIRITFG